MRGLVFAAFTALTLVTGFVAPAASQAAVARASVTAEIVDPAIIDSAKLLSVVGGASSDEGQQDPRSSSQVQPELSVTIENGIQTLHIDYN